MLLVVLEDEYCHFENWDLLTRAWRLSTVWLYRKYARSLKTKMTCSLYRGRKRCRGNGHKNSERFSATQSHPLRKCKGLGFWVRDKKQSMCATL